MRQVGEDYLLTRAEIIHVLAAAPYLDDAHKIEKMIKTFTLNEMETEYLKYCLSSAKPADRNYQQLRGVLAANIADHYNTCRSVLRSMIGARDIRRVYDVGAGHGQWSKVLSDIFPNAAIVAIDKGDILTSQKQLRGDVFELIKDGQVVGGEHTLFFMAEFLHCKSANVNIYRYPTIENSHTCIIEHEPSILINLRLNQTGGSLLDKYELDTVLKGLGYKTSMGKLMTMFDYYVLTTQPRV